MSTEATITPEPEQTTVEQDAPVIECETEDERVLRWRLRQFDRMGFDTETSFRLAASKVDWHDVESKLLARGCGLERAERIAL